MYQTNYYRFVRGLKSKIVDVVELCTYKTLDNMIKLALNVIRKKWGIDLEFRSFHVTKRVTMIRRSLELRKIRKMWSLKGECYDI